MNPTIIIGLAFFAVFVVGVLWWILITTEGVYLGRRVVIWLYDIYARRYDKIKEFNSFYDHMLLAQPIMGMIAPHQSPLVLDVATGTGRLPDALLNHRFFHGRIIGLDLSRKMLEQASVKLSEDQRHLDLIWAPAENLPFKDDTFDVVTCLESLEFMDHPAEVLGEMVRVLRPGGVLLISNRIGQHFMPGKTFSEARLPQLLSKYGVNDVEIELWQKDYKRVWGMKDGDTQPTGTRPLLEVLRCPKCGTAFTPQTDHRWLCENQHMLNISEDGIYDILRVN